MGLFRFCRSVYRTYKRNPRRKAKKLRKPRPRHQADTPPANGACLLLNLPLEIRLRILEYTLCQKEPIQARESIRPISDGDYNYSSSFQSVFEEWPRGKPHLHILQTCHQLHNEGIDMFYRKNTFGITIYDPGWGGYSEVDVLGLGDIPTAFSRVPRLKDCPNIKLTFAMANTIHCVTLGVAAYKDGVDQPVQQLQRWWTGCGRLEVEVIEKCTSVFGELQMNPTFLFHKLGILRCKSVGFQGSLPLSLRSTLTEVIESDRPVLDLQQAYRDLSQFLDSAYFRNDPHVPALNTALVGAEMAAAKYDEVEFMRIRKEIIEAATSRMTTSTQTWMERGEELKNGSVPVYVPADSDAEMLLMLMNDIM